MILLLLAVQAASDPPMRYQERAERIAQISSAGTGCHRFGMVLDDWALKLFTVQSKDLAFREGTGSSEADTIALIAAQDEQRKVDDGGGNPMRVEGSEANLNRYNAYWRDRCEAMKRDAFMMRFFPTRPSRQPDPLPPPGYASAKMCFKDYCPCQGKQSSLDKMLCDRLEEGLNVEVESMISGRALRAAQEELEAFK